MASRSSLSHGAPGGPSATLPEDEGISAAAAGMLGAQHLNSVLNDPSGGDDAWPLADTLNTLAGLFGLSAEPSSDVPPLAPGVLPEVTAADFERYLRSLSASWPAFVAAREASRAQRSATAARAPRASTALTGQQLAGTSFSSASGAGENLLQAMQEVPVIFFARDFDFAHPDTFAAVCGDSSVPPTLSLVLQERLSSYTDAVECHLQAEICARSDSFFEALGVLTDLSARIAATRARAATLRHVVRELDHTVLGGAAQLAALQRRRRNALSLLATLHAVEGLAQALNDLQLLLEAGDFAAALDVLDDARKTMETEEVGRLHCFRNLGARLDSAAAAVEALMTAEFVRCARPARLRAAALPPPVAVCLRRAARAAAEAAAAARRADAGSDEPPPPPLEATAEEDAAEADAAPHSALHAGDDDDALADLLRPVAAGLLRLGRLPAALRAHREAMQLEVRAAVKEVLNAALAQVAAAAGGAGAADAEADTGEAAAEARERSLGERLRALPLDAYVALLEGVGAALRACVARAAAVHALMATLLHVPDASAPPTTPRWRRVAAPLSPVLLAAREEALRESGEALAACCDAAAQRWSKLLLVRAPVHARLRPPQFAAVAAASNAFADALEAACPARRCAALRAAIATQARALLQALHAATLAKLAGALDAEAWARCDVPAEFQAAADTLVAAGTGLAPPPPPPPGAPPTPAVQLGGASYTVVAAALVLLRALAQYAEAASTLPSLGCEVPARAADALKLFNSRSCQLVLGAGALQVAGLRSITAKHLALASQSLALAGALLPHLRAALARAVPSVRHALLLTPLDRLASDLRIHRTELHAKLVAIASDRLAGHAKRLPEVAVTWSAQPVPSTAPPPSELAMQVQHELGVLRRVLEPLLPGGEAGALFWRVAQAFDRQLADGLARAAAQGGAAPSHAASDADALARALRALPAAEGVADAAPALASFLAACAQRPAQEQAQPQEPPSDAPPEPQPEPPSEPPSAEPRDAEPPAAAPPPVSEPPSEEPAAEEQQELALLQAADAHDGDALEAAPEAVAAADAAFVEGEDDAEEPAAADAPE